LIYIIDKMGNFIGDVIMTVPLAHILRGYFKLWWWIYDVVIVALVLFAPIGPPVWIMWVIAIIVGFRKARKTRLKKRIKMGIVSEAEQEAQYEAATEPVPIL
jgi:hypothetical protein